MSLLRTYERPECNDVIAFDGSDRLAGDMSPGEWVRHRWAVTEGYGMLVAVGDKRIAVLWSIAPMFGLYEWTVMYQTPVIRQASVREITQAMNDYVKDRT